MRYLWFITIFVTQMACATSGGDLGMPCADAKVQDQRSAELKKMASEDQAEREWQVKGIQPSQALLENMAHNDLERRKRVGVILGEGCLKSAEDYASAFIIYQHGNTPDQYLQAFLWSKQAFALGKPNMKSAMAMAVDRYLVSIGHKQLFGTQALKANAARCWCVQPTEDSFPEKMRSEYRGGTNTEYSGLAYLKILNKGTDCPSEYCPTSLLPSPRGTVPGFW